MAAAHLCLNRKLVYGQIIRKIGFQAFNFAADDGRHSRSTVRVILKDLFCGTPGLPPLRSRRAATVRNTPEMTARIWLKRSRLPLRPFCLSATPAKYLPNFLEVTTDPDKMAYDWEGEDPLGSSCWSVGIGGRFRCTGSRRDLAWSRRVKLLFDTHAFIWWDGEQSKLSGTVLDACESPVRTAYIGASPASGNCK